jgi:hypothetical protein
MSYVLSVVKLNFVVDFSNPTKFYKFFYTFGQSELDQALEIEGPKVGYP